MSLSKKYTVLANDMYNAGQASSDIKKELKKLNFSKELIKRVSIASYEAEINIVIHSLGGVVSFHVGEDRIIYLQFSDNGPGIENIDLAMQEGYSTASNDARNNGFGAGMGLPNIKKATNKMSIISDPNGTVLKLAFYEVGE